ncbi:hypothetical protein GCM10009863_59230 [Streptomyces axinellae]|uniref:Uncharacterized protein n=1 Tax=Streptomyces axinellae TaxID=552788 RepID=A0ABN3QU16_9ACTN
MGVQPKGGWTPLAAPSQFSQYPWSTLPAGFGLTAQVSARGARPEAEVEAAAGAFRAVAEAAPGSEAAVNCTAQGHRRPDTQQPHSSTDHAALLSDPPDR